MSSALASRAVDERRRYIPLRADPGKEDPLDHERIAHYMRKWNAQDAAYLGYARTVEGHIRMLAGQQWDVWSDIMGRYVDVLQFMSEQERKHAMRPCMDYLTYWFALTLSKVVENRGVISFTPATSDRRDAMLAEVMDPIWKTLWETMEMDQRRLRMASWGLVAGEGYYHTRVDFQRGDKRALIRPAVLRLERPGMEAIERLVGAAPFDRDGNVLAKLLEDPERPGEYGYDVTGDPYEDLAGEPKIDVHCPLQVRAQWGQHIPWRDKRWIALETFLSPEQVHEQTGVDCPPDHYTGEDHGPGALERMLFGSGYFGANGELSLASSASGGAGDEEAREAEGFVRVITFYEKPIAGVTDGEETPTGATAGGRMILIAPGADKVLWDSERPFKTECAGPVRRVGFLDIPGRPHGTTLLERGVPLQKRLNRIEKHISQHTNLVTDPILLVHDAAGIDPDEFVAAPGTVIIHGYNGPGRPAEWLAPPPLSADVYREKAEIREQLFVILSMAGNQSEAPTADASGELVEQLRVNADRPLTPLTQSMIMAEADVAKDVLAVLPTVWDEEKLIAYAGEDNVVRTITVLPDMLEGVINVRPNLESAAAEAKDKRRARIIQLYELGAFGNPADPLQQPKAVKMLLQLINFPELNRASRPGGVDRVMAEHNLGRIIRGDQAAEIPLLEVYDFLVHLEVFDTFMKAPEYVEQIDEATAAQFTMFRELMIAALEAQQLAAIQRAMPLAQAQAAAQGAAASIQAATGPQDPNAKNPKQSSPAAGGPGPSGAPTAGPAGASSPRAA